MGWKGKKAQQNLIDEMKAEGISFSDEPSWEQNAVPPPEEEQIGSYPPEGYFDNSFTNEPAPDMNEEEWDAYLREAEKHIPPEREEPYIPPDNPEFDEPFPNDYPLPPPPPVFAEQQHSKPLTGNAPPPAQSVRPPQNQQAQPHCTPKQESPHAKILVSGDMLEGRQTYTIKPERLDEILNEIFSRLDIPAIEFEAKHGEILIEAGGGIPAEMFVETDDQKIKVPLDKEETETLDEAVEDYEKNGKEKD